MTSRSGIGYDSHRLEAGRRLVIGGVEIEGAERGHRGARSRRGHRRDGGRDGRARGLMAREIRIHDTLTGEERRLETREPGRVGIYACGPTVYAPVHVGNARPYVVFTLLKRF